MSELEPEILEKIDELNKRIKDARQNGGDLLKEEEEEEDSALVNNEKSKVTPGKSAGSQFLASVMAGFILGYAIDHYFMTKPWGMLFFKVMGFVAGVYSANSIMKKNNE